MIVDLKKYKPTNKHGKNTKMGKSIGITDAFYSGDRIEFKFGNHGLSFKNKQQMFDWIEEKESVMDDLMVAIAIKNYLETDGSFSNPKAFKGKTVTYDETKADLIRVA